MTAASALHRCAALVTMASKTGWTSVRDALMTWRISLVAACCSCASASRFSASASCFSRSRTLAFLGDLRAAAGLVLDFAGFGPRRISLPLATYESAGDRLGDRGRLGK